MIPLKDHNPTRRFPFVNVLLILVNLVVFVYQFFYVSQGPAVFIRTWGFIPYELSHLIGVDSSQALPAPLTLISAMFIHGGWVHFLGNMLYLWVFGDNVEDCLGHGRYLLFYLSCGIAASLAHGLIFAQSQTPVVGASGAIAGVLGAYMLKFPGARVSTLFFFFIFIRIVRVPAVLFLGLWIIIQIISSMTEATARSGGVAWFAHIGGFAAGMLLILPMIRR